MAHLIAPVASSCQIRMGASSTVLCSRSSSWSKASRVAGSIWGGMLVEGKFSTVSRHCVSVQIIVSVAPEALSRSTSEPPPERSFRRSGNSGKTGRRTSASLSADRKRRGPVASNLRAGCVASIIRPFSNRKAIGVAGAVGSATLFSAGLKICCSIANRPSAVTEAAKAQNSATCHDKETINSNIPSFVARVLQ